MSEYFAVLYRLAEALARADTADAVYDASLQAVRDALAAERAGVLTFDHAGIARFRAWRGLSDRHRAAVEGYCPWRRGERDSKPILVPDVSADAGLARFADLFRREGIRALAFIPLLGGGVRGELVVYYADRREFSEFEAQLAVMVANQAAYAYERVLAAEERRRQADRLAEQAALLNLAQDGIMALAMDGTIEFWNRGAERMYGWKAEEALGRIVHELLDTITPAPLAQMKAAVVQGGIWEGELKHRTKTGARRVVSSRWALRTNALGRPIGILEITRDVTDQKAAEKRVEDVLSSIRESFIAIDRDWRLTYVNDRAAREMGISGDRILGRNIWEIAPEYKDSAFYSNYRRVLKERKPVQFEVSSSDGARCWEVHAYPTEEGLSAYILDVTSRVSAERALRQAAKLESLGVLAGGIAHDFNNLLTGILGCAGILQEEIPAEAPFRFAVDTIAQASERAANLTRQMLAYSGRGHFVVERLDLSREVGEIVALLQASMSKDVHLILELPKGLPPIDADAGQLQQLVMNLVINAAEAIPGRGAALVRTELRELISPVSVQGGELPPGEYVTLMVKDTGIGMDEATLARIFDPFFTTKFTGRGLGLAAALGIVRGHKGGVRVESAPGRGAVFTVFFPAARGQIATPDAPRLRAGRGAGAVLVIDDEEVVLKAARAALEKQGYRVTTASDGRKGVELFAASPESFDLVLLDMTMPVMGGEEAFRMLRQIKPEVRVLGSSGYSGQEAARRFGEGLAGFIQKPYGAPTLCRAVGTILAPARADGGTQ